MKGKSELGGFLFATKVALGGALGFEIFVYLGLSYKFTEATVIPALLISGLLNLLTMFSYSELSAVLPEEGAEYTYAKAAFGGFAGFTAGCIRWFSSVIGGALAAGIFTDQLVNLLSPWINGETFLFTFIFAQFPLSELFSPQILRIIISTILIVTLTILSVKGTKKFDILMIGLILGVFFLFVAIGFFKMNNVIPGEVASLPKVNFDVPVPGLLLAAALMLQPFLGMRSIAASVTKIREPEKNVPRAVVFSTMLLMLVYFGTAYIATSALQNANSTINSENYKLFLPIVGNMVIPSVSDIPIGSLVMTLVGMVVCISGISSSLVLQGSILCGMSKDRYLPKVLSSTHKGANHMAVITSSLFTIIFTVAGVKLDIGFLAFAATLLNILVFVLVNLSVIGLRRSKPYHVRPFKAPLYPLSPIAGIISSLGLLISTNMSILTLERNIASVYVASVCAVGVLLGLTFLAYYLRMVGPDRLRVTVGGISLGLGVIGVLSSHFVASHLDLLFRNIIPEFYAFISIISVSILCIVIGIWNIFSRVRKRLSYQPAIYREKKNNLIKDTVEEETSRTRRITKKTGRRFSVVVIITGLLLSLLSFWSIHTSQSFLKDLGTMVLGLAGVVNITCGLLLINSDSEIGG